MKKSLKIALTAFCATALVAVSVLGTLAYLTSTSGPVINTFVEGKLLDGDFLLQEHVAEQQPDGSYNLTETLTQANKYTVIPGVELPKDPSVTVELAEKVKAYLFVEVINNLPEGLIWEINSANWTPLLDEDGHQVESAAGNPIWVYNSGNAFDKTEIDGPIGIILDDKITVPKDFKPGVLTEDSGLVFNAYLCQATSFDNALQAGIACFSFVSPVPVP